MSHSANDLALEILRQDADGAEADLHRAVRERCPSGPDGHNPVQHRDGKPPWCPSCGRTRRGEKIKEIGS